MGGGRRQGDRGIGHYDAIEGVTAPSLGERGWHVVGVKSSRKVGEVAGRRQPRKERERENYPLSDLKPISDLRYLYCHTENKDAT